MLINSLYCCLQGDDVLNKMIMSGYDLTENLVGATPSIKHPP